MSSPRKVAVLGATGSVGKSGIEVIAASSGRLAATVLTAHSRFELLVEQAQRLLPKVVVATDRKAADAFNWKGLPKNVELVTGSDGLLQAVRSEHVDVVLAGIVGSAGLRSVLAALEAGKTVALANKETLVSAGPLVSKLLAASPGKLLPVDSEHSALFQAMQCGKPEEIARVVLTASGGPFRTWPLEQLRQVTVDEALAHPTWDMGPKITIDSATMMNKALEIIEARWLFDLPAEKIDVMIHPQSIVHSLVEFIDGSILAQMSPPDMRLPIQYALEYPHRQPGVSERLDWKKAFRLEFEPPDRQRFPAIALGFDCARAGGTSGAVLNAANEAAVQAFLDGELHFTEIVPACRSILEAHPFESAPSLERLLELDEWARQEVLSWVCA
jgi:1-deoxy-D-xylulose-5-phosphate reductoisomerase